MQPDTNSHQNAVSLLIFGIFLCGLAAVWTSTGKAWLRSGGWLYRAKEPKSFWFQVTLCFLLGLGFIGYYLYLTN